MLRRLGAAYYQTRHGRGTAADAARPAGAVTACEARNGSQAHPRDGNAGTGAGARARHPRRWRTRVARCAARLGRCPRGARGSR